MLSRLAVSALTVLVTLSSQTALFAQQSSTARADVMPGQYDGFMRTADASCEEDRWPLRASVLNGKIFIGNGSADIAADGTFEVSHRQGVDEYRFTGTVKPDVVAGSLEILPFSDCMFDFEVRR